LDEGDAAQRTLVLFGAVHGVLTLRKLSRFGTVAQPRDGLPRGRSGEAAEGRGGPLRGGATDVLAALEPSMLSAEVIRALLRGWGATEPHLADAMRRARKLAP